MQLPCLTAIHQLSITFRQWLPETSNEIADGAL